MGMTYAGSGVNYDQLDKFKRDCQEAARQTAGNIARALLSLQHEFSFPELQTLIFNTPLTRHTILGAKAMYAESFPGRQYLSDRGIWVCRDEESDHASHIYGVNLDGSWRAGSIHYDLHDGTTGRSGSLSKINSIAISHTSLVEILEYHARLGIGVGYILEAFGTQARQWVAYRQELLDNARSLEGAVAKQIALIGKSASPVPEKP